MEISTAADGHAAAVIRLPLPCGGDVMQVEHDGEGYRLHAPGSRFWYVSRQGTVTGDSPEDLANAADPAADPLRQGPVEVLARAVRGQFCLHASAILVNETEVVAFVGPSGAGKSTLARLIHERTTGAWQRVADDVLPVCADRYRPLVDASFPQPRLQPHEQFRHTPGSGALVLTGIYHLDQGAGDGRVSSRRLRGVEAVAIVAGNTMGARLFDRALLEVHLAFSATLAAAVPVHQLRFPRRLDIAGPIMDLITAQLGHLRPAGGGRKDDR